MSQRQGRSRFHTKAYLLVCRNHQPGRNRNRAWSSSCKAFQFWLWLCREFVDSFVGCSCSRAKKLFHLRLHAFIHLDERRPFAFETFARNFLRRADAFPFCRRRGHETHYFSLFHRRCGGKSISESPHVVSDGIFRGGKTRFPASGWRVCKYSFQNVGQNSASSGWSFG